MDDSNITVLSEYSQLQEQVKRLRTELSMLILERDELIYVQCKNLEMQYMLTLGGLEYSAYELQCSILRLRRKAELIQARKNRQEAVSIVEIDAVLDAEFEEYQKLLNDRIDQMNDAMMRNKSEVLDKEKTAELKTLYRKLVKALHPDLHPGESDAMITMFHNCVSAYENGDLAALRILYEMTGEPSLPEEGESGMAALIRERERLTGLLEGLTGQIERIKSEYPYTMKALLQDPDAIEEKRAELEAEIAWRREMLAQYKARINELLR